MIFYLKMEGFLNMQNISLNKLKKVHFIGIGGISMSALAEILIEKNIIWPEIRKYYSGY